MKLESLTMKLYSSLISNSDGIFSVSFSVHPPFASRSLLVRFSFASRSLLDRFSIDSRSVLVRFSIGFRSSFVHPPFILRSFSVRESKIDRRTNGESSEAKRRCIETLMGNQGKGDFLCSRKVLMEQLMDIDGN